MDQKSRINNIKLFRIAILFFVLAVFVFLAPEARAIFGLDYLTEGALNFAVLFIQGLIMGFIGTALAWTAYALAWFLKFQGEFFENVTIVQTSWTIFRDFANMFFILILIIIAFATIFDWQNYNWKGLMAKFIIAALLINFSLAIGGFLIGISTNLSNIMLKQFGDITSNLAGGLGITKIADIMTSPHGNLGTSLMSTIISVSGTIIIASVALLAMFSALVFSIVRVPVLWALLIVSPIAWITGILPATRGFNKKWWNWFIGWTFFLPMYLFALMMGFVILKNRPDLGAAALLAQEEGFATTAGNIFGFAFQDIFYYTLTLIILIGGLAASLKASFAAGSGATKAFGTISGGINNWAKKKAYIPAMQKAGKEKLMEIQDTGLPGKLGALYGGERAERLRAARVAGVLGKKEAMSEAEAAEVQKDYTKYKAQNLNKDQLDSIESQIGTGKLTKYQELAVRKMRAENGWVAEGATGKEEIENTIKSAGKNSKFTQEYLDALKKNNFSEAFGSQAEIEQAFRDTTILPLKKAIGEAMVKNNQILGDDLAKMVLEIFQNEAKDVKDKIEEGLQKNIKNFDNTKEKDDRTAYLLDATKDKRVKRILARQMSDDNEINTYQKYHEAAELFGGEREIESRKMLDKVAKENHVANAEIRFRQEAGVANPELLNPTSPDFNTFSPAESDIYSGKLFEGLKKMSPTKISEVNKDQWNIPEFKVALEKKIEELQTTDPGWAAIPRGGRDRMGRVYRKGRNAIPGAGERFITNMTKLVASERDKLAIAMTLTFPPIPPNIP